MLLVLTNGMWLWTWNQYDYVEDYTSVEADDGSNANFIGGDGDITNGSKNNQTQTEQDT